MKFLLLLLFFLNSLFAIESLGKDKNSYQFTSELELQKNYFTIISPYFYKHKLHYFTSYDSLKIAYRIFLVDNAKAAIVISSGRTEGMLKYQELIYDLNQNGFSVYILDHRGQGNSERMLKDTQVGYIDDFEDYVKDLHQFVNAYVDKDIKRILVGHSMGGAIASLYVEEYQNDFDGVVLSSPMHKPNLIGDSLSNLACEIMEFRENDVKRYVIGEKSYDNSSLIFKDNVLTHSKIRYDISKIAYNIEPSTKIGGPSVRWVKEACRASEISVYNARKITVPLLLLQAQEDKVVLKKPQDEFCRNSYKVCKKYKVYGAYHELFVEKDSIRTEVLTQILDFISKI